MALIQSGLWSLWVLGFRIYSHSRKRYANVHYGEDDDQVAGCKFSSGP